MHRHLLLTLMALLLATSPALAQDSRADAISYSAANGDIPTVTRILDSGFDVNTQWGMFDQFALQKAAEWGQTEMVRLLLSRGADPKLKDSSGRTARDWAKNNQHAEVVRVLREAEGLPAEEPRRKQEPQTAQDKPQQGAARPNPAPTTAPAANQPAAGVQPQDGRWRGTIHGITRAGTQYVEFRVKGGRIVDSTFNLDYHCAPQYVYRERTTVGFNRPIAVTQGRFTATRKEPAVELNASGRFATATTAEGTFKMEDSNLCTTRLARWTAKRVGG